MSRRAQASAIGRAWTVVRWHRRTVASSLAGVAVLLAVASTRPAGEPTAAVWAATRDLRGGETVGASDVRRVLLPEAVRPEGALDESAVVGRVVAAPVRRGEPLTDVRVVGRSLLAGYGPGLVVSPVRLADPGVARLLAVGDVVDVLAADDADVGEPSTRSARMVARGARVVLVPAPDDAAVAGEPASLLLLATPPGDAAALAQAAAASRLSAVLRE